MTDWISKLSSAGAQFMPHGHCYLWIPSLLWLHVVSDLLIGAAYVGISVVLWMLVRRLRLPFSWVFIAFGLFIALCGGTHFMQVWTVWNPDYWLDGLLKGATAAASVATAVGLLFVKPQVEAVVHTARLSEERRIRLESTNAELETLYRKVKELDELKSQFFANVSHELRTPLALILGPAQQLLGDAALSPAQRRQLESVRDNGKALLKQVNDLLDVSKLEAGKMTPRYAELDLAPWLRRVVSHFELAAEQRRIALQVLAPAAASAQVDPDKLERALINLLSNALKFTPDGGRIAVSLVAGDEVLSLSVADTGPGVPPDQRELVFERFRQAEGGASRVHGGTGLGLAIVRDFIALQGGRVTVSDADGGGAVFELVLPRHAPAGTPVAQVQAEASDVSTRAALDGALQELRADHETATEPRRAGPHDAAQVLVIEDNREMREFVAGVLAESFEVITASDGEQGLAIAEAARPDLIVTDVMMPRMSGDRLLSAVRARREFDATPVLLLSARSDDELRVRLLGQGAQDYLTKPFLPAELKARAGNLVATKRAGDMLRRELTSLSTDLEGLAREISIKNRHLQTALDAAETAREQAERASMVKSHFLGMLSHEWRTPLATIMMNLQLLKRDPSLGLSASTQVKIGRLTSAAQQLNALIEGLLEYTRVESGRLVSRPQAVDLGRLAEDTVDEYRLHLPDGSVQIRWEPPQAAMPAVHTDPRLLKVVLSNLLGNAVKFTDQGTITVRLRSHADMFAMEVHDTGIGIPPDALERLFLPFEQLEPLQRKTIPGVGLGLTLVRQIVAVLGGKVEVESREGHGSSFRVLLPFSAPALPALGEAG